MGIKKTHFYEIGLRAHNTSTILGSIATTIGRAYMITYRQRDFYFDFLIPLHLNSNPKTRNDKLRKSQLQIGRMICMMSSKCPPKDHTPYV